MLSCDPVWVVFALIWPFLFAFYGLCVGDCGWSMSSYKNFFEHPAALGPSQVTWLTNFVGALFYTHVSPNLVCFRLLAASLLALCALLAWRHLSRQNLKFVGFGIFFTMAWMNRDHYDVFNYNHLAGLTSIIAILLLADASRDGRLMPCFVGGVAAGLSMMSRLPNAAGILGAAVLIPGFGERTNSAAMFRAVFSFVAGFCAAVSASLLAMRSLGHLDTFIHRIRELFAFSDNPSFHHSIGTMTKELIQNNIYSLAFALVVFLFARLTNIGNPREKGGGLRRAGVLMLSVCFVLVGNHPALSSLFLPGLMYIVLGQTVVKDHRRRILVFSAFLLLLLPQLGSAVHIKNSTNGMWLAGPMLVSAMFERSAGLRLLLGTFRGPLLAGLFLTIFAYSSMGPSDDWNPLWKMPAAVDDPKLAYVYTTPSRALAMNGLLAELKHWSHVRTALCLNRIAIVHYLTDYLPFLDDGWLQLIPNHLELIEKRLAELPRNDLPLVVRSKVFTLAPWPEHSFPPPEEGEGKGEKLMTTLFHHGYRKVWENDVFEIYATSEMETSRMHK